MYTTQLWIQNITNPVIPSYMHLQFPTLSAFCLFMNFVHFLMIDRSFFLMFIHSPVSVLLFHCFMVSFEKHKFLIYICSLLIYYGYLSFLFIKSYSTSRPWSYLPICFLNIFCDFPFQYEALIHLECAIVC
jgi:hypothetical protein